MEGIVEDLLSSILRGFSEILMGGFLYSANNVMYPEQSFDTVLNATLFTTLYQYLYVICGLLLCLKMLKKGFMIYVLWRDGDMDTTPKEMLIGLAMAGFFMVGFPTLYGWFADIVLEVNIHITNLLLGTTIYSETLLIGFFDKGIPTLSMGFVWIILYWITYFSQLKTGCELLVLRIGAPIGALGLIDSDNGIFKPYVQQLFKCAFTILIQTFAMTMSMCVLIVGTGANGETGGWQMVFWSIAWLMVARGVPVLLNQFMVYSQGGGIGQKVSTGTMIISNIKNILKH